MSCYHCGRTKYKGEEVFDGDPGKQEISHGICPSCSYCFFKKEGLFKSGEDPGDVLQKDWDAEIKEGFNWRGDYNPKAFSEEDIKFVLSVEKGLAVRKENGEVAMPSSRK
ncbi:MAG: hypothetical protein WC862_03340 [Patescibacteria group bacterium]